MRLRLPGHLGRAREMKVGGGEAGDAGRNSGRLEVRPPRRLGWPSSNAGAEAPYDLTGGAGACR
jgi:hypothetical protein